LGHVLICVVSCMVTLPSLGWWFARGKENERALRANR
jgi:hypothetical protein